MFNTKLKEKKTETNSYTFNRNEMNIILRFHSVCALNITDEHFQNENHQRFPKLQRKNTHKMSNSTCFRGKNK